MKVLMINTVPYVNAGMSVIILNYYKNLKDEVTFDFIVNDFIEQHFFDLIDSEKCKVFILPHRKRKIFSYIKNLRKIAKIESYDIIHIHGNSSLMAIDQFALKNATRAKILVHCHGSQSDYGIFEKLTRNYFHKNYDKAITVELEASYLFNGKEHKVLNNGIDVEKYCFDESKRRKMRQELEFENNTVLLHVGRMNTQKNHKYLIDVFNYYLKKDPNSKLILIGSGELEKEVLAQVRQLELSKSISFIGDVEDTSPWYSIADVFVFPSTFEPFGLVAVEAQANLLPCVFSDRVSEKVKVIDNVTYLPIGKENINEWVKSISVFANIRKSQFDQELDDRILQYDIAYSAKRLKEIYEQML